MSGDRDRMGLHGPPKVWDAIENYNPDQLPSRSGMFIVDRGSDIVWILQVKGLGVFLLRAGDSRTFFGLSEFSEIEIHTGELQKPDDLAPYCRTPDRD